MNTMDTILRTSLVLLSILSNLQQSTSRPANDHANNKEITVKNQTTLFSNVNNRAQIAELHSTMPFVFESIKTTTPLSTPSFSSDYWTSNKNVSGEEIFESTSSEFDKFPTDLPSGGLNVKRTTFVNATWSSVFSGQTEPNLMQDNSRAITNVGMLTSTTTNNAQRPIRATSAEITLPNSLSGSRSKHLLRDDMNTSSTMAKTTDKTAPGSSTVNFVVGEELDSVSKTFFAVTNASFAEVVTRLTLVSNEPTTYESAKTSDSIPNINDEDSAGTTQENLENVPDTFIQTKANSVHLPESVTDSINSYEPVISNLQQTQSKPKTSTTNQAANSPAAIPVESEKKIFTTRNTAMFVATIASSFSITEKPRSVISSTSSGTASTSSGTASTSADTDSTSLDTVSTSSDTASIYSDTASTSSNTSSTSSDTAPTPSDTASTSTATAPTSSGTASTFSGQKSFGSSNSSTKNDKTYDVVATDTDTTDYATVAVPTIIPDSRADVNGTSPTTTSATTDAIAGSIDTINDASDTTSASDTTTIASDTTTIASDTTTSATTDAITTDTIAGSIDTTIDTTTDTTTGASTVTTTDTTTGASTVTPTDTTTGASTVTTTDTTTGESTVTPTDTTTDMTTGAPTDTPTDTTANNTTGTTTDTTTDITTVTTTDPTPPDEDPSVIIVASILAVLLLGGIVATGAVMYRRGNLPWIQRNSNASVRPQPIALGKFETHCNELLETPARLGSEYQLLLTLSTDVAETHTCAAAQLPDNKKKNRYINILPYDLTRVKLDIINEDPSSDYTNASFIKGFSNSIEYIASQGPKEETLSDFWRMIYQHDVYVMVMVTNFEEGGKVKCDPYLPKLREQITLNEIVIRCATELNFPMHTQRTLILHKDGNKRNVTHLHFREWPDFGCPDNTDSMLQFCCTLRHHVTSSPRGLILVHCSAGVGRTGTLIAVDILLQHIQENKKVDVFGTVFKLRKQRTNMVQTMGQYAYIYRCIKDAILDPSFLKPDSSPTNSLEPIYENVPTKLTSFMYEKLPEVKAKSNSSESECEL